MTLKIILSFIISLLVTVVFGKYYIPWLRKQKAGQEIKENGPEWHMYKSGTPTMGGIAFIIGIAVPICLYGILAGDLLNLLVFLFACFYAAIGFLDDWEKIKKKQNLGLSAKAKFALQALAALVFIYIIKKYGLSSHSLYFPFFNKTVYVPGWLFYPLLVFIVIGTVNAVNITDGIDGLASGTTIPVMLFFVALSFKYGRRYEGLGVFASAVVGALVGFLFYNFHPANVFMGDTGSLFLGAIVVGFSLVFDMPLVLITLGLIYIIEVMSDIIQVSYFKITKKIYGEGKRVFKMAPFHHHLEMGGWTGRKWKEIELFYLFTGSSLLLAVLSFLGVMGRQ